jgi:hypothetical protein
VVMVASNQRKAELCRTGGIHSAGMPDRDRPSPAAFAARDLRLAYVETFETRYLGDPPPGRSAFDKRPS